MKKIQKRATRLMPLMGEKCKEENITGSENRVSAGAEAPW